jgi:hypothetical protein
MDEAEIQLTREYPMPKYAAALCLAALLICAALHARDDDPEPKIPAVQPRAIVVRGLPREMGQFDRPASIRSERHLAEVVPNEETRRAILKQVNFEKEHLLLFCWVGSSGDRLRPAKGKAGEATFELAHGEEGKINYHAKLFAIPARAKVVVKTR